ncbi:unnamed protein product [Natator depressus]
MLNGLEAVKEVLLQRSEDFADRPPFSLFDHLGYRKTVKARVPQAIKASHSAGQISHLLHAHQFLGSTNNMALPSGYIMGPVHYDGLSVYMHTHTQCAHTDTTALCRMD